MKFRILLFIALIFAVNLEVFAQKVKSNTEPLQTGAIAPDFTLSSNTDKQVTLSKVNKPTVLVFYRGYWWPYCVRQLADLRKLLEVDENIALFAISVDTAEKSKIMMQKVAKDGKGEIMFPLLSDPNHETIDNYGLFDTRYMGRGEEGIPQTAIYILDKERKIIWANVSPDYRNRPTIETLRMEINKFKKMSDENKNSVEEEMKKSEKIKNWIIFSWK